MKKKIAIVGSGVSAMTCAYYLINDYEIFIFEKNDYLGGHTHTHTVKEGDKQFTIDSGFMVFNNQTYGNMLKMFSELGVEKQESDMSFSVFNKKTGLQYCGSSFSLLFSQRKNVFSIEFWRFLLDVNKFFKVALRDRESIKGSEETIRDYCRRNNLSDYFIDNYLAPMSAAVWSVPQADVYDFPISLLLPFFYNHGLLGMNDMYQWYSVKGGSDIYIKKIIKQTNFDIHLSEGVELVSETEEGVSLRTPKGNYLFDFVVLASHANESIKIFKDMPREKRELLESFGYNSNKAVLHTDSSVMPPLKKVWSSWNQIINKDDGRGTTVYWMNRLQKPVAKLNYFVSINPLEKIAEDKVIKEINYEHPNFTVKNFLLQNRLPDLNKDAKVLFAGAYFGYGFHEDGVKSGLAVAEILKTKIQ